MDQDMVYKILMKGRIENNPDCTVSGMDDFFVEDKMKVSSLDQLFGFSRISDDTLVHKSKKDLWRISEDPKGEVIIERLFDPNSKEALQI